MDRSASKSATVAQNESAAHSGSGDGANNGTVETAKDGTSDTLPIATAGPAGPANRGLATREPADHGPAQPGPGRPADQRDRRDMPRSLIAAIVVGVLVISGAVALNLTTGALDRLNPFRNGVVQVRNIDRSGPAVLKAITDLGSFRAASGYYELVVDVEKDVKPVPSFLAGERVLFIAAGTVEVGVDLRGLGSGAVVVNDDRTSATITLPKPTLSKPSLDVERSYIYSQQRGLMDRLKDAVGDNANDQEKLYALASQRLADAAARTDELTTRGETNTRSMLEGLLRSLGFTSVTVNFAG
jgi:hypothetical protein